MTLIYIQQEYLECAETVKAIFESRLVEVEFITDKSVPVSTMGTVNSNTLLCSSTYEEKLGGEQNVIDLAKKFRAGSVIIINESSDTLEVKEGLGGKLTRFSFNGATKKANPSQDFQLQLLISLIQPLTSMVAGDNRSSQLLKLSQKVAQADVTVFINGPTGTGKEVLSKFIHAQSTRHNEAFVGVNCAAIPENMLEAILFGHEKGSFTGASTANKGIFRAADKGTLLLDEISEMPMSLQAKLLRVLQEKAVTPLGSHQDIPVDVRVIATTNRCMATEIKNNRFREDLYYRLNVFPLATTALKDRLDDIIPITASLLLRHVKSISEIPLLDDTAIDTLLAYPWPGNVRELENVIQRALVLSSGKVISESDIIVDSNAMSLAVHNNIREQVLSKATA